MRYLISLLTYNEIENLPIITKEIFEVAPDVDILVVDDNSPDGTSDWAAEQMQTEPRLKLIKRASKQGLGTATLAAMNYAIENEYDYLINLDADISHPPRYIPELRKKAEEGVDVVIGSRYTKGGKIEGWSLIRRLMSKAINFYARTILGLKTKDNSGSFRCYKTDKLKTLDHKKIVSKGYAFLEEVLYRLKKQKATFAEVPITFVERKYGKSKINKKEAITALCNILYIRIM
ncbi:MAG: polyprenol monophosphomannose synthase [Planctomycetaceae bacterium]|jgi:dolichol-phosphate mannosyltransferase|nr:polyprenol monophosphomannose synthase [Planctomycetaceae bacterium]